jgi:DUF177 domain-containing protein
MKLDLSRLRSGVERLDRRYEPAAFHLDDDELRLVAPVSLTGEARKDARKVRLVGRVATTLECQCSRCLEPFAVPVDAAFDLLFLPADANTGQSEQEVAEDDLGVGYYRDDVIDLGEVMREQFYLALPMKPLCRDDCRGLCPVCGVNRNVSPCSCQIEWVDPRMSALKQVFDKKS